MSYFSWMVDVSRSSSRTVGVINLTQAADETLRCRTIVWIYVQRFHHIFSHDCQLSSTTIWNPPLQWTVLEVSTRTDKQFHWASQPTLTLLPYWDLFTLLKGFLGVFPFPDRGSKDRGRVVVFQRPFLVCPQLNIWLEFNYLSTLCSISYIFGNQCGHKANWRPA